MDENTYMRADVALYARGLAPSRERAQALIAAGLVYAGETALKKSSQKVGPDDALSVRGECCPYVSRGGFKLARALTRFGVSPEGKQRYMLFFKARDRSAIDQAMSAYAASYVKKHKREHPPIEQVVDPLKEMLPGRKKDRVLDKGMQR